MINLILAVALVGQVLPYDDPKSPLYMPPEIRAAQITANAIRESQQPYQAPANYAYMPMGRGLTLGFTSSDWRFFLACGAAFVVSATCYGLFLLRKIAYR